MSNLHLSFFTYTKNNNTDFEMITLADVSLHVLQRNEEAYYADRNHRMTN